MPILACPGHTGARGELNFTSSEYGKQPGSLPWRTGKICNSPKFADWFASMNQLSSAEVIDVEPQLVRMLLADLVAD